MDSRNSKLADFEKQYIYLKQEYSNALSAAINSPTPELVTRVLQINAELTSAIRSVLGDLNKGSTTFDASKIEELTAKLVDHQKDYAKITASRDKIATLKIIRGTTAASLSEAVTMYNIYVGALVFLCFIIVFLVFNTTITTAIVSTAQAIMPQEPPSLQSEF